MAHDEEHEAPSSSSAERAPDTGRTARPRSTVRAEFAERAAAAFDGVLQGRVAAGDRRASNRAIGDALGVDEARVRVLRDGRAPLYVGDLLAMGDSPETRAAALAVLDTIKALIQEGAPCVRMSHEARMLRVVSRAGELAAVVSEAHADGVVDDEEQGRISHYALSVAHEASEMARASLPPTATLAKAGPRAQTSATKLGIGRTG